MLAMFLLFAVLSSGAVLGCFVLKKEYRFEEYAPISCMIAALWLFCCGLLGTMKLGFWLLMTACAAIYVLAFFKGSWQQGARHFFTPGFVVFILLFISVGWINFGMLAHEWDEFSHWALVVKEMTLTDALPCSPAVRFTFYKSYPPIMPVFQYMVQKLNGGNFTEWLMYAAYQVFMLSFCMPFMARLNTKKWYSWLFIPAMWLSPMLFFNHVYSEIYIDPFLGVVSGACLAAVVCKDSENPLKRLFILLGAATLTLTKDIGLALAAFLALAYVLSERNRKSLLSILFVAVPRTLWELSLRGNGVVKPEQGSIDMLSFFRVVSGREESYRADVLKAFFYPLVHWYLLKMILLLAGLFVVIWYIRKKPAVWWTILLQTVLYIFGMLLMYLYMFSIEEAYMLASFDRYINVVFTAMTVCLVLCSVDLPIKHGAVPAVAILAFVLALTPFHDLYSVLSRRNITTAHFVRDPVEQEYCSKVRNDNSPGSRILYGSGKAATLEFYESRFILAPDYDVYWEETND